MAFYHPIVLWGLLALAIPIIIHLFNFRKHRKVLFSNTSLLLNIQFETKKQSRLKSLLVLLLRILAIAAIVFAFARPFLPTRGNNVRAKKTIVGIYLDNSMSMEGLTGNISLLENAKRKASEIVGSFGDTEEYFLLTNDLEGDQQVLLTKSQLLDQLNTVDFSHRFLNLDRAIKLEYDLLTNRPNTDLKVFVISDFQTSNLKELNIDPIPNSKLYLVPIQAVMQSNLAIDTVYLNTPVLRKGEKAHIKARIANYSSEDREKVDVQLFVNDKLKSLAKVDVAAYATKYIELEYILTGDEFQNAFLEVNDYPVTFDNRMYFSFPVVNRFNVLEVYQDQPSTFLKRLLDNDSLVNFLSTSSQNIKYNELLNQDLVILNGMTNASSGVGDLVKQYLENHGNVLLIPNSEGLTSGLEKQLLLPDHYQIITTTNRNVVVDYQNLFFQDVFQKIPEHPEHAVIKKYIELVPPSNVYFDVIMKVESGEPLLIASNDFGGRLFQVAFPLDLEWTNLPKQALFVPMIYQMMITQYRNPLFQIIGQEDVFNYTLDHVDDIGDKAIRLINKQGVEIIPMQQLSGNQLKLFTGEMQVEEGFYDILSGNNNKIGSLAFNYDRYESDMRFHSREELKKMFEDRSIDVDIINADNESEFKTHITELSNTKELWKYFVILALVFVLLETAVLRLIAKAK